MTEQTSFIGDRSAQARFIERNRDFVAEQEALYLLLKKLVLRELPPPPQEDIDRLQSLPFADPARVAADARLAAGNIIYWLGRVLVDDFGEVVTLAGNGRGIGAKKILRGMYESVVTAAYLSKEPDEAPSFLEESAMSRWKLWSRILELSPEAKDRIPTEMITELEGDYQQAKANRPKGQREWTKYNLPDRAKRTDDDLFNLYVPCYLEPTLHAHPSSTGLVNRFVRREDGVMEFKETTEEEAGMAVLYAHLLLLEFVSLYDKYFALGMKAEIQPRLGAFRTIWKVAGPRAKGNLASPDSPVAPNFR